MAETAAGRPAAGARRLRSALRLLDREGDDPEAVALTGAVLVSLAHAEAEQGRGRHGLELLDRAEELLPGRRGLVLQQRGLLLLRMGRTDEALPLLNRAVPLLAAGGESSGWGGASSAGTAYSSLAHAPKSMSLQRSEQNG